MVKIETHQNWKNVHKYRAAFCVTEIITFTCHLCGYTFLFWVKYCVDFDWGRVNILHRGWFGIGLCFGVVLETVLKIQGCFNHR